MTEKTPEQQDKHTRWERRFQSVMLSLATAGILWSISTQIQLVTKSAVAEEKLQRLDVQLSGMYSARDAQRDVAEITGRIAANEGRIDTLDTRVGDIERYVRRRP